MSHHEKGMAKDAGKKATTKKPATKKQAAKKKGGCAAVGPL